MDKITLAFTVGETRAAFDAAHAILHSREHSLWEKTVASLAAEMLCSELERLVVTHFLTLHPHLGTASVEDMCAWARLYCTENPEELARLDERLKALENGGEM